MNRCDRQLRRQGMKFQPPGALVAKAIEKVERVEEGPATAASPHLETPRQPPALDPLRSPTSQSCEYLLRSYTHSIAASLLPRPSPAQLQSALAAGLREGAAAAVADINMEVHNGVLAAASLSLAAVVSSGGARSELLGQAAKHVGVVADLWARAEELAVEESPARRGPRIGSGVRNQQEPLVQPVELLRYTKYLFGTGKARRDIHEPYSFFDHKLKRARGEEP